jgi:hypothetical protein
MKFVDWVKFSGELMTVAVSEETYQDDLRYERAVWPEKFVDVGADTQPEAEWRERVLLALQGIDVSLETLAAKPPVEINVPSMENE